MTDPEDEDDKPTVVLDLNALKKQKLKQEEELANIAQELEFSVGLSETPPGPIKEIIDENKGATQKRRVILFDFQSTFFENSFHHFPQNSFDFQIAKTLPELNKFLGSKDLQIVIFNYDSNPKAIGQLCAQIKLKFPKTKTIIIAKNISPEKANIHAKTAYGANGYYQLPIHSEKLKSELLRVFET
jgi:hypothetical protein